MKIAGRVVLAGLVFLLMSQMRIHSGEVDPVGTPSAPEGLPDADGVKVGLEYPEILNVTTTVSPASTNSFLALGDDDTSIPPDTHGAAGPSHLMVMLNTQVRIQNRTGTTNYLTTSLSNWWSSVGSFTHVFDPRILYDPYEQRWIAVAVTDATKPSSALVIGASQTDDPTGSWYLTKLDADGSNTRWADYPSIGFNKRWIVVNVNMFSTNAAQNYPFAFSKVYMFNKTNVYAGGSSRVVTNLPISLGGTYVPAVTYDTNVVTEYLLQVWNSAYTNANGQFRGSLRLYTITGAATNPVFRATTNYPTTTRPWTNFAAQANFAKQTNTSVKIDCGDGRIQNVSYRNGHLWCAHTIFLPYNASATRSAIQWWQISTNGAVPQVGRLDDPAAIKFYAYPSIGVNRFNDVLIGYSRFSSNQFPSANYAFRHFYDIPNSLGTDTVLKNGEGIYYKTYGYGVNRWGDYSATMPDPANHIDFWTIQEYAATPVGTGQSDGNGRWGTWWGRIPMQVPANDNFNAAQEISDASGSVTNANYRGTKESGEPNHAGNTGGRSIWYKWTAPRNGLVGISTIGSSFDTTLGIYTGSSVSSLTTVTNDNDSGGNQTSRVVFNAVSNTTYSVAVDGFSAAYGQAVLNWNQPFAPMILGQPETTNVVANANEYATFSVVAIGEPSPAYQWKHEGTNVPGATSSSYTITNVQTTDATNYFVVVTNTSGSVTSMVASLIVHADSAARLSLWELSLNQFRVHISGLTNRGYIVQTSTNLNGSTNGIPFLRTLCRFGIQIQPQRTTRNGFIEQ